MQINRDYERDINLRDLFFHLCYRWRAMLVAALIGAVLLGTFQFYSIYSVHREGQQTKEEKQYEIDLQTYKDSIKNARNSIRTYNKLIKEKSDYLDESVYMGLDSQEEWVGYKRYYIRMSQAVLDALPESIQEDPADYVASTYVATLKSGLDAQEMEELLGTGKREYVDELVSAWADNASNTITVQVIGADAEMVTKQLDYFVDRIMTVCAPLAQKVGEHTLALVNEDCMARTDSNLSAKQDEINQQIVDWQEALKEQREALNDLEEKDEPNPPGDHIKRFAAIGFILGAFLLAGIFTVKYFMSRTLRSGAELTGRYNLPVYGEFAKSRAKKPGKGLDKLFEKWEFKRTVTDRDAIESGIGMLLKERFAGKRVLITGTVSDERLLPFAEDLRKKLDGACEIVSMGNLPLNSDAIVAAVSADAVILAEEKYASRNAEIERAAELLGISEARVAGCVIL